MTPGQFFQVSLPKIGEAPLSISAFGPDWIQFTVRAVGRLTNALQDLRKGENLFIRGPYGVGSLLDVLQDSNLVIVAGGSGTAPVRPLIRKALDGDSPVPPGDRRVQKPGEHPFSGEVEEWRKRGMCSSPSTSPRRGDGPVGLVTEHIGSLPFPTLETCSSWWWALP